LFYDYPLETDKKFDQYCGKIYEEMRKRDEDPVLKKHLSETLLKIEEGNDEMVNTLHFNYTRRCALDQIRTCRRMNAYFDAVARETDVLHLKFFAEAMDLLRQK
jgi:arginyl-tRNA synthetase